MKIKELADKLDATLIDPFRTAIRVKDKQLVPCDIGNLRLKDLISKSVKISYSSGQYILVLQGEVQDKSYQIVEVPLIRMASKRYAGIFEPLEKINDLIW